MSIGDYLIRKGTKDDIEWANKKIRSFVGVNVFPDLVLVYKGVDVGIVGIARKQGDVFFIDLVELLEQYRDTEFEHGSRFLELLENMAKQMGCKIVRTGRVPNERSEKFWRTNGFETFSTEDNGVPTLQKNL